MKMSILSAVESDDEELALSLLPGNLEEQNQDGDTALSLACMKGMERLALEILRFPHNGASLRDIYGQTPLMHALFFGLRSAARALLQLPFTENNLYALDDYGNSALNYSSPETVSEVLAGGRWVPREGILIDYSVGEEISVEDFLSQDDNNIVINCEGYLLGTNRHLIWDLQEDAKFYACGQSDDLLSSLRKEIPIYDLRKVGQSSYYVQYEDMKKIWSGRVWWLERTEHYIPAVASSRIVDYGGTWVSGTHCSQETGGLYYLLQKGTLV